MKILDKCQFALSSSIVRINFGEHYQRRHFHRFSVRLVQVNEVTVSAVSLIVHSHKFLYTFFLLVELKGTVPPEMCVSQVPRHLD